MIAREVAALRRKNSYRSITDRPKHLPMKKKEQSPAKVPTKEHHMPQFHVAEFREYGG
jgi:hypothetical protein